MEWISVKDRLPKATKINDAVLVYAPTMIDDKIWKLYSTLIENGLPSTGWAKDITHWMPLPEPPKQD